MLAEFKVKPNALNELLGFQAAAGVLNYSQSSDLSISLTGYEHRGLCLVEAVAEDLHGIRILQLPGLGLRNIFRSPFTIYHTLTGGIYISVPFL